MDGPVVVRERSGGPWNIIGWGCVGVLAFFGIIAIIGAGGCALLFAGAA